MKINLENGQPTGQVTCSRGHTFPYICGYNAAELEALAAAGGVVLDSSDAVIISTRCPLRTHTGTWGSNPCQLPGANLENCTK